MYSKLVFISATFFIITSSVVIQAKPVFDDERSLALNKEETVVEELVEAQSSCNNDVCGDFQDIVQSGCEEFCSQVIGFPIFPVFPSLTSFAPSLS